MKYNLLGAVGTIALGAAFGMGTPGAANAGLTCTGTVTTGSCTETDRVTVNNQDFTNVTIPVDLFHNNVTSGPIPTGVLSGVTYSVGGTTNVVGTLSNTGAGTATGQFTVTKDNFTFAGTGTPSNFIPAPLTNIGSVFSSPTVTLSPGQFAKFSISNPFTSGSFTPGPAGFSGVGTFNAIVNSLTKGGASSHPSDFSSTQTGNATAFVTITYNYTTPPPPPPPPSPTPEPASLALLGVGLAGLGAIRRRRKA